MTRFCTLRFLPVVGGSLANLSTLWKEYHDLGYLPICESNDTVPMLQHAVALTGMVPREVYAAIFPSLHSPEEIVASEEMPDTPEQHLLTALQTELRRLRERGEFKLTERFIRNIRWADGSRFLIYHSADTATTFLNASHPVWHKAVRRYEKDHTLLPLLVSSIYTAINRALKDVEDIDELQLPPGSSRRQCQRLASHTGGSDGFHTAWEEGERLQGKASVCNKWVFPHTAG